ncbi:unnamed protein product, partial [Staurois parvus]
PSRSPTCAQQITHLCPAVHLPVPRSATYLCPAVPPTCAHPPVPTSATHLCPPTSAAHQCHPPVQPSSAAISAVCQYPSSVSPLSAASQCCILVLPIRDTSLVLSISAAYRCHLI